MARRGRKRNFHGEYEHCKLILAGTGRTTGHRWRSQRGGLAQRRLAEVDRHERYLSLIERERIALFR